MRNVGPVKPGGLPASLLAAALAIGCASPHPSPVSLAAPVAVGVGRVDPTDLATPFEAGGIVRGRLTAPIASRIMAAIVEIRVRPGDKVRRGDRLVALDAREITATGAGAAAVLAAATESARAADADLRAAEAAVVVARATHDRIDALFLKRSATASELDQAIAARDAAEAQRSAAASRVAAANAARQAAQASSEAASTAASYAILSAPFDGTVLDRRADPGSLAVPGAPILILEDTSALRLEVPLDESRAAIVQADQPAEVRIDGMNSDGWISGRVVEVGRVDSAAHSFLVKIEIPSTPRLRSGLFGRAKFVGPMRRGLTVPASAVVRRGQLAFVYIVDEGVARLRPVTTSAVAGDRIELLAGPSQGTMVVTDPPASLADGTAVRGASR